MRTTTWSVLGGLAAGALYTVSPLGAWTVILALLLFHYAGRGLPPADAQTLKTILAVALFIRVVVIGGLFLINMPKHDAGAVSMLSGDEAYGMSRALRTRDVVLEAPRRSTTPSWVTAAIGAALVAVWAVPLTAAWQDSRR